MERSVVLEAVKHGPPAQAKRAEDGSLSLTLNLPELFHHGYIEKHDCPPEQGSNPLFVEYRQLLEKDSDELRWSGQIARGDHKGAESQVLGRIFARYYLSMHGYRWFPDIKDLLKAPFKGWTARRPSAGGDMPDWLAGGPQQPAVAEAKGRHSPVPPPPKVLARWRRQVENVEVFKDGAPRKLKSWIVATRWVGSHQPGASPKMYAEDPEANGLREAELGPFELWLARVHTLKNLRRLEKGLIAARLTASGDQRTRMPLARPMTWSCAHPKLQNIRFIGRPLASVPLPPTSLPLDWRLLLDLFPFPVNRQEWERWWNLWGAMMVDAVEGAWFDGLAVPVLQSLMQDRLPEVMDEHETHAKGDFEPSFLRDGSLLAPLSFMKPVGQADF